MALEVEDGSGKTNAESYLSEADADTYWSLRDSPAGWTDATTTEKEAALRIATEYGEYGGRWRGYRSNTDQALDWPRMSVADDDGILISYSAIPARLEAATAELAYRHLTETGGIMPDISMPGGIQEYAVKAGPVEEKTVYTSGSQVKWYRKVDVLLRPYLTDANVVRG